MADADITITAGAGTKIDTRTVGAGTDEHRQVMVVGDPSTASAVASVTAAEGLDVDVTRLPADPLGANADAIVAAGAAGSISAKLRRATQALEDLKTLLVLGAGTNNIGDVDVLTLPALPAGTNNIGDVDVLTQPARSHATDSVKVGDGTDLLAITAAGEALVRGPEPATFLAVFDAITPAVNKYMATLFNGASGRKVVVHRIWGQQWTTSAVTGVGNQLDLRRITARTTGTTITPKAHDSNDAITAGITCDHNTSAVTEDSSSGLVRKFMLPSEEAKTTAGQAFDSNTQAVMDWFGIDGHLIWTKKDGVKGITLRNGEGLTIKNLNGTVGALSFGIEFTDEAA